MSSLFHCPTKKKFSWNGSTSVACSIPIQKTRTVLLWRIGRQFDGNGDKLALIWPIDDDYKSWKHRRERHCKSKRQLSISFASSRWNYNKIKVFLQIIPRAFSSAPMMHGGTVSQTNCPLNFGPKIRIIFFFRGIFSSLFPVSGRPSALGLEGPFWRRDGLWDTLPTNVQRLPVGIIITDITIKYQRRLLQFWILEIII